MRAFTVVFLAGILTLATTYSIIKLFDEDSDGFFKGMME